MSAPRPPQRVAVIGTGFGRTVVVPGLRAAGFEVAALLSGSAERAESVARELGIAHAFPATRLDDALSLPGLDLVFVASPPAAHASQSMRSLSAGKHVVCEKPTALDANEAATMLDAARHSERIAVIDHEMRFSPVRRRYRELVADGFLGRVFHIDLAIQGEYRLDATRPWTWWADASQGGGFLGAIGSHAIDAIRYTFGEIAAACGTTRSFIQERPDPATGRPRAVTADDYAPFWLQMESGAMLTALLSAVARAPRDTWKLWAHGESGSLLLDEAERLWGRRAGESEYQDLTPPRDPFDPTAHGMRDTPWTRAFVRLAREVHTAITEGRSEIPLAAGFDDGLRVQQVLDAIRLSSRERRWVDCGAMAPSRV